MASTMAITCTSSQPRLERESAHRRTSLARTLPSVLRCRPRPLPPSSSRLRGAPQTRAPQTRAPQRSGAGPEPRPPPVPRPLLTLTLTLTLALTLSPCPGRSQMPNRRGSRPPLASRVDCVEPRPGVHTVLPAGRSVRLRRGLGDLGGRALLPGAPPRPLRQLDARRDDGPLCGHQSGRPRRRGLDREGRAGAARNAGAACTGAAP